MKFSRGLLLAASMLGIIAAATSCKKSELRETWEEYEEWRTANDNWLREMTVSGRYERVVPSWNRGISVLMRWENDRSKTENNLTPYYTSQVSVKYKGWLMDGTPFDSSYAMTDSISTMLCTNLIEGWIAALEVMHVGDTVELIVPYTAGYGSASSGLIPPYSCLRFKLELCDIPAYEVRPKQ